MADMMNFPKRWEDFLHDYEFEDVRRIYTNGSRLIPSFRVKQMMEHYAPVRHGRWLFVTKEQMTSTWCCSECGRTVVITCDEELRQSMLEKEYPFCHCGTKMDGGINK